MYSWLYICPRESLRLGSPNEQAGIIDKASVVLFEYFESCCNNFELSRREICVANLKAPTNGVSLGS